MFDALLRCKALGVRFALPLADVERVLPEGDVMPVPGAPPSLAGVSRLEKIGFVPLFSLAGLADLSKRKRAAGSPVVVFVTPRGPVALQLDEVQGTVVPTALVPPDALSQHTGALPTQLLPLFAGAVVADADVLLLFSADAFLALVDARAAMRTR